MCFKGEAQTKFCDGSKTLNKKKKHVFSSVEEYFHINFYVFGGEKTEYGLQPGEYK